MKTTIILTTIVSLLYSNGVFAQQQKPSSSLRGAGERNLQTNSQAFCNQECRDIFNDDSFLRCVRNCRARTPSSTPAPTVATFAFAIINPTSGRALEVEGGNCAEGTATMLRTADADPAQRFYFGPGNSIINVGCDNKAITRSTTCTAGSAIVLSTYTGGPEQQWQIQGDHIVSTADDCNFVLDVFGRQTQDGANIILYPQNGQENQDWVLED